jgi:peptide/nickel transport system substrate-binding protein
MFLRYSRFSRAAPRLVVIAWAAAVLTACVPIQHAAAGGDHADEHGTPIGDRQVRSGGELVMGLSGDPDQLDPTTSSSSLTRNVLSSICEKLYDLDGSGQVVPQLATGLPTISGDGQTVTIPVRGRLRTPGPRRSARHPRPRPRTGPRSTSAASSAPD